MGAETVIKKIEEKAQAECDSIYAASAAKAEQLKKSILDEANEKARAIIENEQEKARLLLMRGQQQATLEKRIRTLDHRHALIDAVKAETLNRLNGSGAEKKLTLFTRLVEETGICGSVEVAAAESELSLYADGRVLELWAKRLTELTGKQTVLTLAKTPADITGGVILRGEIYDIDLSSESVVAEMFANNEKAISDKLFGEGARA